MIYVSAYLWEKAEEKKLTRVSLVLQQAEVRKKTVLLACVCEGGNEGRIGVTESGYFTEGLVEWFHKEGMKLSKRKGTKEELGMALKKEIARLQKEIRQYTTQSGKEEMLHYWGILIWENCFWQFVKGNCEGYLLNRRFGKKQMRKMVEKNSDGEEVWICGKIQKRLGILLCTKEFFVSLGAEEVAEVLTPDGEMSEKRLEKRLKELRWESKCRDERAPGGAIYIRSGGVY